MSDVSLRPPEEAVEHEGGTFQVEQVEGRRIRRVCYSPPRAEPSGTPGAREAA